MTQNLLNVKIKMKNKERIKMTKKNYLVIGAVALIFIIAIIAILLLGNNKEDWTKDILDAQSYQITMTDCNGREKILDNSTLKKLSDKWSALSNNGPWTGDTTACYTTVTVSYENNGIINTKEIVLVDTTSLALIQGNSSIYYTNAKEIIDELYSLFIA